MNLMILMNFSVWNSDEIWHQQLMDLSTSLVSCCHFTGEIHKSFFNSIIHIYFWLFVRTTVIVTMQLNHQP